jgi:hypothetical protein
MENNHNPQPQASGQKVTNPILVIGIGEDAKGKRVAIPELTRINANVLPGSAPDVKTNLIESIKPKDAAMGFNWANWGDLDQQPNEWEDKIKASPTAAQAIMKNIMSLMSDGLVYCDNSQSRKHPAIREEAYNQEVEDFLATNDINQQMILAGAQFFTFAQFFVSYTMTADRKKIGLAQVHPCAYTRISKQDDTSLRSKWMFYSEKFGNRWGYPRAEEIVSIPLMNKFEFDFFDKLRGYRFARHFFLPLMSHFYYVSPPWNGLFMPHGWIDVSAKVPKSVSSMQDNQLRAVYIIRIDEEYFRMRYVNHYEPEKHWDSMTPEVKIKIMTDKVQEIEASVTGSANAGKSIFNMYSVYQDGKKSGLIEIEAVDNKIKSGDWLPDVTQADSQIVLGMGVSGSMYGLQNQGGKMGAGSGSDKMQDRNIAISTNTMIQSLILEWLNYISQFNKWGVTFYFRDLMLTTKDKSAGGFVPPVDNAS